MKNDLVGKWGGVNLRDRTREREREFILSEDLDKLENYPYIHSLHQCVDTYEDYLVVEFYDVKLRVKSDVFHSIDVIPKYKPMDKVKFINSKGVLEYGIVKGIHWHNNNNRFYYHIEVDGKMKSRHYYDEDLAKT